MPLAEAAKAHQLVEDPGVGGKVVLVPSPTDRVTFDSG